MKIAFLACAETMPGAPERRPDAFEHDLQIGALREGLAGSAAEVIELDWRGPLDEIAACDLALLGTAWNYTDHPAEFAARLDVLQARGVTVCNPPAMVRWNSDKSYLTELAAKGVPSIPTHWEEDPGENEVNAAMAAFGTDRVVVKRRVGAGAIGQFSFRRGDPALLGWHMGQPALIQPFLPAIAEEGEYSFIFIDGEFSHAVLKRAAAGDYRIQSLFGGTEMAIRPSLDDIKAASEVMGMLPFDDAPLYARIDMVRASGGRLSLMEAELIEPYLYPLQRRDFGRVLARAVLARD